MTNWNALFEAHIAHCRATAEDTLSRLGLEGLVIGAGTLGYYHEDDNAWTFRPSHHYAYWCPHPGEESVIHVRPGRKPLLHLYAPADYWYEHAELGTPFWADAFDIQTHGDAAGIWRAVTGLAATAWLGPDDTRAEKAGLRTRVPQLAERLNWARSFKTEYELACTRSATRTGADGHRAARAAFLDGGTELDCHRAFLAAADATEAELPYPTIVALDAKAAVLHYHGKRREPGDASVLLIDAGTQHNGYACDITRTHCSERAPPHFQRLVTDLERAQQALCAAVKPGMTFTALQDLTHEHVGRMLLEHGIIKGCTIAQAIESGLTSVFFPHGIGHLLGLHVHDVAGKQGDAAGTPIAPDPHVRFKYLRSYRTMEPGMVFTVEPGVYFIDVLLADARGDARGTHIDWTQIERYRPFGGVRIEDNVCVTKTGHENLTRAWLPRQQPAGNRPA
jgi:Xaa-Pro dipeptidase